MAQYTTPPSRSLQTKVVPIVRTDSATEKCVLPKGAVVCGIDVVQLTDASAAATYTLGWSGTTTALLNAFALATTAVGHVTAGAKAGAGVGTQLDSDKMVIATFGAGSSTSGGTGYAFINYFVPGPGEGVS